AQHFGDYVSQYRIRALTDVYRAAHHAHAALTIKAKLHAGMRHVVPVDRQARAAQVRATRKANALAVRKLAIFILPVSSLDYLVNALAQPHTSDAKIVRRERIRKCKMPTANFDGVNPKLFGELVELDFEREARLWRAVSPLRAARRFIREDSKPLEFVTRHIVGDCLKRACVERARNAIAAIRSAIKQRAKVHCSNRAVTLHAGLHPHQNRMATAMAVEDFFARQSDFDRAARDDRKFRDRHFMIEGVAFAAESAAVRCGDNANVARL